MRCIVNTYQLEGNGLKVSLTHAHVNHVKNLLPRLNNQKSPCFIKTEGFLIRLIDALNIVFVIAEKEWLKLRNSQSNEAIRT